MTSDMIGMGKVVLNMTYGQKFTLNNVLHVPDIKKSLISGTLLIKAGFRLVFWAEKFVMTKKWTFQRKKLC